ncbi:(2Fe-2S)-binding protein [Paraflavitalea sp. CAU 1676]|uniref:(2Fe-2S)-binding protein n=1 Tax=Paraflavitalea sp. CAU 1676 TaxID=3032598 RepID=UPI0023DB10A9|nr:(2Fe-2S)-binding protein [Paraflavitalea sp. CAU 1676]MDF2189896.1 (2Fe-2S)-binding protein [Paraflavitalea sp. CAU 1676]
MEQTIVLKVNGKSSSVTIDPETPLLYALRNNLHLNGPKYGCGMALCGSCMVLLDGKAQPSCIMPCSAAAAHNITTLEGIGTAQALHPLQQAVIETQAAQCGYCLNGVIMCAKQLLDEHGSPSEAQIKEALQRVLCRCGTHTRFIAAIKKAAAMK